MDDNLTIGSGGAGVELLPLKVRSSEAPFLISLLRRGASVTADVGALSFRSPLLPLSFCKNSNPPLKRPFSRIFWSFFEPVLDQSGHFPFKIVHGGPCISFRALATRPCSNLGSCDTDLDLAGLVLQD